MLNLSNFNAVKPEFRAGDTIALNIDNATNNVEMVITPIVVGNQGYDIIKIQGSVLNSTIEGINQNDVSIYGGINVDTISIKGGDGVDTIVIGGDDIVKIQGLVLNSTIDGGSVNDNLVISGADLEKYIIVPPYSNDSILGQQKLDIININSLTNMINNLVANDGNRYENEYTGGLIGSFDDGKVLITDFKS